MTMDEIFEPIDSNYIGILEKEIYVYRVFKFEHLLNSIMNKCNVLVTPDPWDAPF
jgi:hypothetical protein